MQWLNPKTSASLCLSDQYSPQYCQPTSSEMHMKFSLWEYIYNVFLRLGKCKMKFKTWQIFYTVGTMAWASRQTTMQPLTWNWSYVNVECFGIESLTKLISTIAQRLGDDFDVSKSPHIMVIVFAPNCRLRIGIKWFIVSHWSWHAVWRWWRWPCNPRYWWWSYECHNLCKIVRCQGIMLIASSVIYQAIWLAQLTVSFLNYLKIREAD